MERERDIQEINEYKKFDFLWRFCNVPNVNLSVFCVSYSFGLMKSFQRQLNNFLDSTSRLTQKSMFPYHHSTFAHRNHILPSLCFLSDFLLLTFIKPFKYEKKVWVLCVLWICLLYVFVVCLFFPPLYFHQAVVAIDVIDHCSCCLHITNVYICLNILAPNISLLFLSKHGFLTEARSTRVDSWIWISLSVSPSLCKCHIIWSLDSTLNVRNRSPECECYDGETKCYRNGWLMLRNFSLDCFYHQMN